MYVNLNMYVLVNLGNLEETFIMKNNLGYVI